MARYAIYLTTSGSSTARPVTGFVELPDEPSETLATRVADQPLEVNEAIILLDEDAQLLDLNSEVDTYGYTVNPTSSPAPLTAVSQARYSLQQRQAEYRRKRDALITEALPYANFGRNWADGEIANWLSYLKDLRDMADAPADPEGASFPSAPGFSETGGLSVWLRLYRRGNVMGNVSLTAGVPTGAIMDEGNTSGGQYVKLTNGLLLCNHRAVATYNSALNLTYTWTFAEAFGDRNDTRKAVLAIPSRRDTANANATGQLSAARMADMHIYTNTFTKTSCQIVVADQTASLVSGDVTWLELFSIGSWRD